jgi:RNA polymerase-associated protein CTR9
MDTHIFIPVAGSDEVVAVPLAELPAEAEDLLDILKAEEAPLSLWLDFARAYLAEVSACSPCALQ